MTAWVGGNSISSDPEFSPFPYMCHNDHVTLDIVLILSGGNGKLANETTGLVDKQRIENFSSPSLHPNSSAGSHNSRCFHHSYHSLAFPRSELQTLGMLGMNE